ncbi:FAD-dependent oxidoreductase [Williamsia sp.]|uniref:FAD-dependent oxidoreductase n=1 Tax=Williamsia sp. TaxID=1872085 RepID=UPI002F93E9D4
MSFVVTQPCCNDATCVDVCPVSCIRPTPDDPEYRTTEMLYIDPQTCIDCGACTDACPVDAIYSEGELPPEYERYVEINADYFRRHPLDNADSRASVTPAVKIPREDTPLRVAVVGSGPAGIYAAAELLSRSSSGSVEVEVIDRLPTPWGLIRAGVAPDHLGTKEITNVFRRVSSRPGFRFHLNVEVGRHLTHDELLEHHHAVIYAVGALGDRKLGVPGEDLLGSVAASEFVAWYNGHPDYAKRVYDLSGERVVVVGNGNVALDVARILVSNPDTLASTDIAEHALEALRSSNIREVIVLGRRGPAQAAYTSPELIALRRLPGVDVVIDRSGVELGAGAASETDDDAFSTRLKVRLVEEYAALDPNPANKRIVLRYLASPTRILGHNRVEGIEIVRNELVDRGDGSLEAAPTDRIDTIEASLVLRSIGFRGTVVPGVPFDDERGVIPNIDGRVLDPDSGKPMPGVYTTGWVKRGPSGVIGTNKQCAQNTVEALISDLGAGRIERGPGRDAVTFAALMEQRNPAAIDGRGWQAIDAEEKSRGGRQGRPRAKITDIDELITTAGVANRFVVLPADRSLTVAAVDGDAAVVTSKAVISLPDGST